MACHVFKWQYIFVKKQVYLKFLLDVAYYWLIFAGTIFLLELAKEILLSALSCEYYLQMGL